MISVTERMHRMTERMISVTERMHRMTERMISVIECNILWYNQYQNRIFLKYVANFLSLLAKGLLRCGNNI